MDQNSQLTAQDQEDRVKLLSPMDSKHWELVQLVNAQYGPDCTTTYAALEKAGVPPNTYYRAMRNPVVQQLRLEQIQGTLTASQHLIERNWLGVLASMASIARKGDSRESVQAARFLRDVYKDIQQGLGPNAGDPNAETEAARTLRRFLSGKEVKRLRRTTVTEEIEVQPDDSGTNGPIIDG